MKFKNHTSKLVRQFVIYSDCEAALKRLNKIMYKKKKEEEVVVTTEVLNRHNDNRCGYYFVCNGAPSRNKIKTFEGDDCIYHMLNEVMELAEECVAELQDNQSMKMIESDEINFPNATHCHICSEEVNKTGKYA